MDAPTTQDGGAHLRLRLANLDDERRLLEWRNDSTTVEMSRLQERVSAARHAEWLRELLARPSSRLFIAETVPGGDPVGTGRLDRVDGSTVELSLTVDPRSRGRGYGTAIIAALIERAADEFPGATTLKAEVREENRASARAFAHFAFVPCGTRNGLIEMTAPLSRRAT